MPLDYSKGTLLVEFKTAAEQPTLDDFKQAFGLQDGEVDDDYGLMPLHESVAHQGPNALIRTTWMATVSQAAGDRIEAVGHTDLVAVYSNAGRANGPEL